MLFSLILILYFLSPQIFLLYFVFFFFFFNDTATTEIYTLSLHDALPIFLFCAGLATGFGLYSLPHHFEDTDLEDRKSTRLNSSHVAISYAVFCLKKKKKKIKINKETE